MKPGAEIRLPFWPNNGPIEDKKKDSESGGCSTPSGVLNESSSNISGIRYCKVIKAKVTVVNGACVTDCLYRL